MEFGGLENKRKYNGIEKENDLQIEIYDAHFRELDVQIGRWWQIDPVTEGYEELSPYASMYNNPIFISDPMGNEGEGCCGWFRRAAKWVGNRLDDIGNSAPVVWINNNLNPLTPVAEFVTGRSLNSGFTENKSRAKSAIEGATFLVPTAKAETIIINETKNLAINQIEKHTVNALEKKAATTAEKKVVTGAEKNSGKTTDFVVTEKGTAITIPSGATGPHKPNKGSGMVYSGGTGGGKGLGAKVAGVRIMDANKNQGRRVNYMNENGQTVNPKSGRTISNSDKAGHIPID